MIVYHSQKRKIIVSMIEIKTFTCIYDEKEDRIRLAINYQDPVGRVDFMITRKFVLKLFPVLEDTYYKHFENIASSVVAKNSDVNNTKTDDVMFQLSMDRSELLHKVDLKFDEKSKSLTLVLYGNDAKASARMDANSYKSFLKILQTSVPSFSWGIHNLICI